MKAKVINLILTLMLLCSSGLSAYSAENYSEETQVHLDLTWHTPTTGRPGNTRAPMRLPMAFYKDHVIRISDYHPDYTLIIKNDFGDIIFERYVYSSESLITLPDYITGHCYLILQSERYSLLGSFMID
jgi:hypothetical protein